MCAGCGLSWVISGFSTVTIIPGELHNKREPLGRAAVVTHFSIEGGAAEARGTFVF